MIELFCKDNKKITKRKENNQKSYIIGHSNTYLYQHINENFT